MLSMPLGRWRGRSGSTTPRSCPRRAAPRSCAGCCAQLPRGGCWATPPPCSTPTSSPRSRSSTPPPRASVHTCLSLAPCPSPREGGKCRSQGESTDFLPEERLAGGVEADTRVQSRRRRIGWIVAHPHLRAVRQRAQPAQHLVERRLAIAEVLKTLIYHQPLNPKVAVGGRAPVDDETHQRVAVVDAKRCLGWRHRGLRDRVHVRRDVAELIVRGAQSDAVLQVLRRYRSQINAHEPPPFSRGCVRMT